MPLILTSVGSSPLTRGIQWLGFDGSRTHGFIPAHAGNTPLFPLLTNLNQVHPRSRGEYPIEHLSQKRSLGSSPLTRGIHAAEEQRADQVRFIPAHAGNTRSLVMSFSVMEVHPRSRGEYPTDLPLMRHRSGSSPLTRGIRHGYLSEICEVGFIPAHAGNTLKKALFYLTFSNTHFHISFNF